MNFRCGCLDNQIALLVIDVLFFLGTISFQIALIFIDPGFINNKEKNINHNIPKKN